MKNTKNISIKEKQEHNLRLTIPYRILSFDLLFFYSISYLFLVDIKGMTTAQIVFSDAFYPFFKLLFQLPSTILINKFGKKNILVLSNLALCFYIILIMFSIGTWTLIIANSLLALSFGIKNMAESTLLYDSIYDEKRKREIFSKCEGKSIAGYYLIDSISSIITGFLYVFNPYLPLVISLILTIIALVLAINFYEINIENNKKEETTTFKSYTKDLGQDFKYIFKSPRLRSLILFNSLFASLLSLNVTLQKSLLDGMQVSSEKFGIIFAIMGIVACFSSNFSLSIHNKLKNKTLSTVGITYTVSMIISAAVILLKINAFFMLYIVLLMITIQYIIKGPFYTLIKRYLSSFSNSTMRLRIFSANAFIEYSTGTIITLLTSAILNNYSNNITILCIGIISTMIMIALSIYMHPRIGLKPEEYSEKDIFCND